MDSFLFMRRKDLQLLVASWVLVTLPAAANPVGGTVNQGSATFSSQGSQFTIRTSDRASINWQSFNIGLGETTTFQQPSSSSVVWNRINDPNASQILGNLNANGYVILQNQNGFFIGGQAIINTHGLLMTTAPIPTPDLSSGGPWDLRSPPPTANIINYGQISTDKGGSVFLISHEIENHGTISSPEGNIGLYAGKEVLISDRADGRGLSARVTLPEGSVDNSGRLIADAGTIALHAAVVNEGGLIQANSVREVNGVIELVASDAINLGPNAQVTARGDSSGTSPGGEITIKSSGSYSDKPGSLVDVSGGTQGGNGGQVEISASQVGALQANIDGRATVGFLGGKLFLDPLNIVLSDSGTAAPGSGTVGASDPPATGTLTLDVNSLNKLVTQNGLSQINLQAANNIELSTFWGLPDSLTPNALLTLTAGNNITLDDGAAVSAGKNWSVNMFAGPNNLSSKPAAGTDGIYLNGSSYIQTKNGDINLWAANEILVATGNSDTVGVNGIRTLGGGNISVTTQYGDVNAGSNPQGFTYRRTAPYYTPSPTLGGISTVAGGDVTINAGGDVYSYLPVATSGSSAQADAGSGAFGSQPGNVTITAGGSVFGHYVLANGVGTITAKEGNVGAPSVSRNLALSLIDGTWSINAPNGNIYLQEVRNPNGVFNNLGNAASLGNHRFDYGAHSAVDLTAGLGVYLTDLSLPRPNGLVPVLYPPTLNIVAGSGGLVLEDDVIMFPSPYGDLTITTLNGGNVTTSPNSPANLSPKLVMSDSAQTRWISANTFSALDHGPVPTELGNNDPVLVTVSGSMENFTLVTTKQTQINVAGDMIGCGFSGENLRAGDTTSINVTGNIYNRSPYSFVFLSQSIANLPAYNLPPNTGSSWQEYFTLALDPSRIPTLAQIQKAGIQPSQYASYILQQAALFPSSPGFSGNPGFVYNPATLRLGFSGQMSQTQLAELSGPLTVLRFDSTGIPLVDSTGHFVTDRVSWANPSAIQTLYQASQGAPDPNVAQLGYRIGGPGEFDVSAASISLGNTYGILSCGPGDPEGGFSRYANLASVTPSGASLKVVSDGDIDMLTSTIAALGGGNVTVVSSQGGMDLGSQELLNGSRQVAFGIFTSGKGNVNVTALKDINIDGSRIASFNGGNITIESLEGNVDAGSGGTTFVGVPVFFVNPATGKAEVYSEEVFGSGIVANTLVNPSQVPGGSARPGNITVTTPQGDIIASLGGILQEALNGNVSAGPSITLTAGTPASGTIGSPDYSPGYAGNINLGDSGVIGGTVNVTANGNITGLVISRQSSTINAAQTFSGTVLSGGTANLTATTVSGSSTIIGVGGVSVSGSLGSGISVLGQNVSVNNGASQSTLGTSTSATVSSQSAAQQANTQAQQQVGNNTTQGDDENKKKGKETPSLVRRVGRVTVILPPG
jgi:filamentous hemagglutinin family protein